MTPHLARMAGVIMATSLCIALPFLPGSYDGLAVAISTTAQLVAAAGLLLVPVGGFWLILESFPRGNHERDSGRRNRTYALALASGIITAGLGVAVSLIVMFGVSLSLGLSMLILGLYTAYRCARAFRRLKTADAIEKTCMPWYLIAVPLVIMLLQVAFSSPLTTFSRRRAIANSHELISRIEEFRARQDRYPTSLTAVWKDYHPDVVGIPEFHYVPSGRSYNLFFEQPRLLIDNFGTREWVVYNPSDDHRIFSHTSWLLLLAPDEVERSQGWYAVHDTGIPHWKVFWFD